MTKNHEFTPNDGDMDIETGDVDASEAAHARSAAMRELRDKVYGDILLWIEELNKKYVSQHMPIPLEEFRALRDAVRNVPDFGIFRDTVSRQVFTGELDNIGGENVIGLLFGRAAEASMVDLKTLARFSGAEDPKAIMEGRKSYSYGDILFSVHRAFIKKLQGILPGSLTPEEAAAFVAAKSADDSLKELLWIIEGKRFQKTLTKDEQGEEFQEAKKRLQEIKSEVEVNAELWRRAPEVRSELVFEEFMQKSLAEREDKEEEAKRIRKLISALWDEARELDLNQASGHIQKIIFLEKTLQERESPVPQNDMNIGDRVMALRNQFASGDIPKEEYKQKIEEIKQSASRKEAAQAEKMLFREAKLLRDLAERCGPNHESYGSFVQQAQMDEDMANLILEKIK